MTQYKDDESEEYKNYIDYYLTTLSETYEEYSNFTKNKNTLKQQIDIIKKENLFILMDCDSEDDIHFCSNINLNNDYWIINKKNISIINNCSNVYKYPHIFCVFSHDVFTSIDEHFAIIYYSKNLDVDFTDDDEIEKRKIVMDHKYIKKRNADEDTEIHITIDNFDEKLDPWDALIIFETSITNSSVEKIKTILLYK